MLLINTIALVTISYTLIVFVKKHWNGLKSYWA